MTRKNNLLTHARSACLALCLCLLSRPALAVTVTYQWSLSNGMHTVSGQFGGLRDDMSGQSVTFFAITASTLGGLGPYDLDDADKTRDFALSNGIILNGNLKFKDIGDKTEAAPRIDFELKWKNGHLVTATFASDPGRRKSVTVLDFKKDSTVFGISEPIYVIESGEAGTTSPVPLPSAALFLLSGLAAVSSARRLLAHHRPASPVL